jgi:hypothetical protein
MRDWTALSEKERSDIENKLMETLGFIGIKGTVTQWNAPSKLPYWLLIIETSWCDNKPRTGVARSLEQAMARANIQGPKNGVVLKSPPRKVKVKSIPKNHLKKAPKKAAKY